MIDQAYRRTHITSIDAATIAGCSPYTTLAQMFYYKTHGYPDLRGNPHIECGIRMEPRILASPRMEDGYECSICRRTHGLEVIHAYK